MLRRGCVIKSSAFFILKNVLNILNNNYLGTPCNKVSRGKLYPLSQAKHFNVDAPLINKKIIALHKSTGYLRIFSFYPELYKENDIVHMS